MAKLIIYCKGNPIINGYRRLDFHWSVQHGCYIYLGRELEEKEFNEVVEKAMTLYRKHIQPLVKVVSSAPSAPASDHQLTAQEAEDFLREVAPERLKAKPGPKPKTPQVMEVT